MLSKKPALALSSANVFPGLTQPPASRSSCLCSHVRNDRDKKRQRRHYATVQDDIPPSTVEDLPWPELGSPPRLPSPYQIFHQKRGEPYSKRRFYELVKLYHPDRSGHAELSASTPKSHRTSNVEKLERYRMIIAANTILSDPAKREAYDKHGHGWSHFYEEDSVHGKYAYKYGTHHRWRSDGSATYRWPVDQDPMYNATWEDWERWYRAQYHRKSHPFRSTFFNSRGRQGPIYANNYAFISVVFFLAALGGAGQATRANEGARSAIERGQLISDESSRILMEARQNTREQSSDGETKQGRIRRFLRESEEYHPGEIDGRALRQGDGDLCAPALVKDRDEPRFWEKPPENR